MNENNSNTNTADIDNKIAFGFSKIYEAQKYLLQKKATELGLTTLQSQVLLALYQLPYSRLSNLAEELKCTKATLSEAVSSLQLKGYIIKRKQKADSRNYNITLSKKGTTCITQLQAYAQPLLETLSLLTHQNKEVLHTLLLMIIEVMNRNGIISAKRMCFNCKYYSGNKETTHFCSFINKPLNSIELKISCTDHAVYL
jgi:DNA-binding MarR family transcriptional regulator